MKSDTQQSLPWVEKYRPTILDEVVGNEETIARLKGMADQKSMLNLILTGTPGVGKTTSIYCLANQMLGSDAKEAVLELNASDERGIDVVRNQIKSFALKKVNFKNGGHKIVILDEADNMTSSAQQALRRIIELYSADTRFALACNMSNKIIEPIQSRCATIKYSRISDDLLIQRLKYICDQEKVLYNNEGLDALAFVAEGDLRMAINNLQSTCSGFEFVNPENVYKICDQPHPIMIKQLISECLTSNLDNALNKLFELWEMGYSSSDMISTIFRVLKYYDMPEDQRLEFIKEVAFTHMRISEGVGGLLQFSKLISSLCKICFSNEQLQIFK